MELSMIIEEILELAVSKKASDIHISANLPPVLRIDGKLFRTNLPVLSPDDVETVIFPILSNDQRRELEQNWELDFGYGLHGVGRFRVNVYRDKGSYAAAFRTINSTPPNFDDLGLPEVMKKIESVFPLIAEQNQADFARYEAFKAVLKQEITKILGSKTELTFEDLEKAAAVYYKFWKAQAQTVGALPKEYESSYSNLLADDERINFKNVARLEIADLVKEMVKNKELDEGLLESTNAVLSSDESTLIGQKIKQKNQEDVSNYVQLLSQNQPN
jgi:hypothetical protein